MTTFFQFLSDLITGALAKDIRAGNVDLGDYLAWVLQKSAVFLIAFAFVIGLICHAALTQ